MTDRLLSVRMDPATREKLERRVDDAGTSRSDVVRDLIMGSESAAGVWVTWSRDMQLYDVRVHASEIEALRYVAQEAAGGITRSCRFIEWGEEVQD